MGALSIFGRLGLDAGPWENTLKGAERRADKFAAGTIKKLGGIAAGAFGINALKQMGLAAIENATEISTLAKQFKITTDQVQQLQEEAKRTGIPFGELVKDAEKLEASLGRSEGNAVVFSQETVKRLSDAGEVIQTFKDEAGGIFGNLFGSILGLGEGIKLTPEQKAFQEIELERQRAAAKEEQNAKKRIEAEEAIAKINAEVNELNRKTEDEGLTKAEKILRLEKERAQILHEMQIAPYEAGTEGEARDRLRLARVNNQIAGLKENPDARPESRRQMSPLTDSLRSVGNFLGGNVNSPEMNTLREANKLLKQIEQNTKRQGGTAYPI
jgi:hypothetical protein